MFNLFSKRFVHGKIELDRFKELMSERAVFEATVHQSATGLSSTPLNLVNKVQESVNLCYSLTSMTSLNAIQLLEAVGHGKWSQLEHLISKYSDSIDAYSKRNSEALKSIIGWADRNNVPEHRPFSAKVYRETGLPRTEVELVSLRFLHIPNASLTEIPKEFAVLPMVMAVCLSGNSIRFIPSQICSMPSVYRLDLDDNIIEEIPEEISLMKQLQTIDLDENNLNRIPKSLLSMRSLKSLLMRKQKHGVDLLSAATPLSDSEIEVLSDLSARGGFSLRT